VISVPVYYSSVEYSPIMGFNGYMETGPFQLDSIESLIYASEQFLEKSKQHLGDKTIQKIVKEGDLSVSILKAAKECKADLIILDSHSRRWLDEIIMGTITEKVLRHTSIPLLIIPTRKK
jgi:nucleotide-binding universal stress UspA family protein